ncbi:translation elongation factor EF-1 gamma subunit [Schizosaccharomyces cryophilus OY26]|uniref:Translation elongation factor EF-1 gamma subunit n=1 Tax=Schizosaccharomyces cryophilus (strain OY26 / ATCC MYA-4695 / CBS 11777 / NBRC 106824 / NRRL Y48691) TaxID=653667 RepID=S9VVM2_SCHCR|nr:translation elongation factor EF-1 gamma subunit [Schizosaccharomyces cryophilus OY26]EPY50224.1 translation elongation factor EF-1 gamma subunit [Schizosaccharomyces cryophilus OY26]
MSVGTVYGNTLSFRVTAVLSAAAVAGVKVDSKEFGFDAFPADLAAKFPAKKVPVFVGQDGFELSQSMAIALYFASFDKTGVLLGQTPEEKAKIFQYVSYFSSEFASAGLPWALGRLIGPYNANVEKQSQAAVATELTRLNQLLADKTYLVGSRLTLADVFAVNSLMSVIRYVLVKSELAKYANVQRYYTTMYHQCGLDSIVGALEFVEKMPEIPKPKAKEAPKKEQKPAEPAAAPAPAAKPPKHPLAALPNGNLNIEEFKRVYTNQDTRTGSLPWFFDHYDPENYSLWKVDYAYPEDLKQPIFMSCNLIGGFFQRLEASRKYIFGCCLVIGENGDNTITGAFVIKGQDHVPAFEVAPDWESYSFTKLDISKPEDKTFLEDAWAWDKPMFGREVADGKMCK